MTTKATTKYQYVNQRRSGFREHIIAIHGLINTSKVFLLKVNRFRELFIEMLDLESNITTAIFFEEKISFSEESSVKDKYVSYKIYGSIEERLWVNEVLTFFVPEQMDYIFIKLGHCDPHQDENNTLNIQVDFQGITLKKEFVTELPGFMGSRNYDRLNGLVVIPDFHFFSTETFKQVDLYGFFDKCLDDEDFSYLLHMENTCSMFATRSKNLYGIILFDRDGDSPRGTFCVFQINEDINPKLIFKHKVDEYGMNHVFSENGEKIAYIYNWNFGEIEVVLRVLNANEFEKEKRLTVYFSKQSQTAQKILLTDHDHIILVFPERFELYSVDSEKIICHIKRDVGTTYELANSTLFYLHNQQLKTYRIFQDLQNRI